MENQSLLLSIVTVTWNCVTTLEKTLKSVQAIKTDEIEYLIIDGVSTDGTLELIKQYDSLVDHVLSERDHGIYNAMNKGASLAKGKYVLFINGDDELIADGFSDVLKHMKNETAPIICTTTLCESIDNPSEILVGKPQNLPFFNSIPHPSSFVKTSLLKEHPFNEELRIAADYDFFLWAYIKKLTFDIVPAITALHYRGGASGDVALSEKEITQIKKENLGIKYPVYLCIHATYRFLKKCLMK